MKKSNQVKLILLVIFLLVFLSRVYFIFQTSEFSDTTAYQIKRYTEHISNTKRPLLYDSLSYNGRNVMYSPLYYYILASFSLILPMSIVFKLIPILFVSSLVFIVYLLSMKFVENKNFALITAFISGFIPVVYSNTLNNISIYSILLIMIFSLVYCLMELEKNLRLFIFLSVVLAFLSPIAFLFLFALLIYLLLSSAESMKIENLKKEAIIFSAFMILLVEFLIYKSSFLNYGFEVIWNNIPYQILASYFSSTTILDIIYNVGALSVIFGFLGIIIGLFRKNKENIFILTGVIVSTLLLLWLRLINPIVGLMFLAVSLTIVSGIGLESFCNYLNKTKIRISEKVFCVIFIILIISLAILPSFFSARNIMRNAPSDYDIKALKWIKENTLKDVTVLGSLDDGHIITEVSDRKNMIDTNFLLAPDPAQRYRDLNVIFDTKSESKAMELLSEYNVDYIYLSEKTLKKYGSLKYTDDKACFKEVYDNGAKVYQITC